MISNRNTQFNYELENKLLRKVNLNNFNDIQTIMNEFQKFTIMKFRGYKNFKHEAELQDLNLQLLKSLHANCHNQGFLLP